MIAMLLGILSSAAARGAPSSSDPALVSRVESGLRAPVLVEGDPLWTIAERLKEHGVPGVSVAVIRDFRIEWAKGYGLAQVDPVAYGHRASPLREAQMNRSCGDVLDKVHRHARSVPGLH